jgi:hypothetical protein
MKTIIRSMMISSLAAILLLGANACDTESGNAGNAQYGSILDVDINGFTLAKVSNLGYILSEDIVFDESELNILLHMKEEEKLAMDVYTVLYRKWGQPVFSNISKAENTHLDAVLYLLKPYGDEYTRVGQPGEYSDSEFKTLYNELVSKGSVSIEEAYKVGALIEELDIKDLTESISNITNENIILVLENLQKGSRNHLRAFNRQLKRLGLNYTPMYISQAEYDQIVNSAHETGRQYPLNINGTCPGI